MTLNDLDFSFEDLELNENNSIQSYIALSIYCNDSALFVQENILTINRSRKLGIIQCLIIKYFIIEIEIQFHVISRIINNNLNLRSYLLLKRFKSSQISLDRYKISDIEDKKLYLTSTVHTLQSFSSF